MTELNQVFDGDLAERVFLIISIIFVVLYACGILLIRDRSQGPPNGISWQDRNDGDAGRGPFFEFWATSQFRIGVKLNFLIAMVQA